MALFVAGMIPTADEFNEYLLYRYDQGTPQVVTSSVTLVDSAIVGTITGLSEVRLSARYATAAAVSGIRWAWGVSGTVTSLAREQLTAGIAATSATAASDLTTMRLRQNNTLTEEVNIPHITTSTTHLILERLVVEGSGTLVFRFAQSTSDTDSTTLHEDSYMTVQRLENG